MRISFAIINLVAVCRLCCTQWFKLNASEQYFPVALFIMLNKVVLTFESVHEIQKCDHLKFTKQHFPVALFIILNEVVLTFESVHEIQKCDHMKFTKQYFPVVLFVMLCEVRILSTESKVRTTLDSVINSSTGKYCTVAFI